MKIKYRCMIINKSTGRVYNKHSWDYSTGICKHCGFTFREARGV